MTVLVGFVPTPAGVMAGPCRYGARMQQVALFDLDNTLVDRRAAFTAWAEEFVATRGLADDALTWLLDADARTTGARGPFFGPVRDQFAPREPADDLWQQYRRPMPYLGRCRPEHRGPLPRLRSAAWHIWIATTGPAGA